MSAQIALKTPLTGHRRLATQDTLLPPEIDPASTRGRILAAALPLFAEQGYGGTSVRDLCARADLQLTTLYAHFPSKEHVLAELVRIGHDAHHRCLRDAMLETQPDPAHQIVALMRAHVASHCRYPMLAVVANAELHALSADAVAPGLDLRKQSEALVAEVILRGIRLGAFKVPDPLLALAAIGGMGLRVAHWYTPDCGKTVDEIAAVYAEFALRILGAAPM
ncbi:MAG: TetR/AcrR family transcriptional regulator [Sinimarinibacterium flocculans]|uniref:TetR/AcrR family transcriptional regulator n=1 Tax=Sinimarinibacterium flocculans TaxID=985250 RepID=UPI003C543922